MICQSCGKVRNKVELFYTLSLPVKGSTGIHDSLTNMVKGSTIEDYTCEGCNKKVNVTRRSLLADTPNVLIVHLQRICFSFDTFQNEKLNTRFDFPKILDLKPYSFKEVMKEKQPSDFETEPVLQKSRSTNTENIAEHLSGIPDDDYVYRLVGANIHTGTADHGHYYSHINTKRGSDEPNGCKEEDVWAQVNKDPWKEFNDDTIKAFNYDNSLNKEALGGN